MATQTFNLNAAVESWRQELSAQRHLTPDARRELETHLFDSFSEMRKCGDSEEEAFVRARKRTGELSLLNREFKIAMKTMIHKERPLAIAAWVIYLVSFCVPAFDQMPGWKTAILQSEFWPQALQGQWISIHYLLLTFANLLMLASPVLMGWAGRDARYLCWLRGLGLGALILVWSFVFVLIGNKNGADLRIGCYLWASSFVLLCVASLLQRTSSAGVKQTVM